MTEEFPFFARAYQWLCRDIRDKPLSPLIDTLKDKLRQRRRHRLRGKPVARSLTSRSH